MIDLRSLWPWDKAAVLASVEKTGRLLVAHEAVQVGGFGAEIAATVAERAHGKLKAPVRRLGAPRAPISYAPNLEDQVRVTPEQIASGGARDAGSVRRWWLSSRNFASAKYPGPRTRTCTCALGPGSRACALAGMTGER